jgi:hypothetical protein
MAWMGLHSSKSGLESSGERDRFRLVQRDDTRTTGIAFIRLNNAFHVMRRPHLVTRNGLHIAQIRVIMQSLIQNLQRLGTVRT